MFPGVASRVDFVLCDFLVLEPFPVDCVFLSPPWGGPGYTDTDVFDCETMITPPLSSVITISFLLYQNQSIARVTRTSRDRPNWAPYPKLKNCKRTSKCQFTVLDKSKNQKMDRVARWGPPARAPGALKRGGDTSKIVNILSQLKGEPFGDKTNFRKKSAEKLKEGHFGIFKHPMCCKISKKLKGAPLERQKFRNKVLQCRKTERGDPLVSPGMVCYAGKQEKPFWFISLSQMVQFGAIISCRTFKNNFGQFVWIGKKKSQYNSRVSLHEAPTKKRRRENVFFSVSGQPPSTQGLEKNKCIIMVATESVVIEEEETIIYCI